MNIFEQATRAKLRFSTPNGMVSTEDLWDLPLTSLNSKRANLDDIARTLDAELKSTASVSFVSNVSEVNATPKLDDSEIIEAVETRTVTLLNKEAE